LQSNELLSQVRSSFSRHVQLFDITFHLQDVTNIYTTFTDSGENLARFHMHMEGNCDIKTLVFASRSQK
ncbi:unnamed protein product, partial [Brassica rapa subsp. trilocularis]